MTTKCAIDPGFINRRPCIGGHPSMFLITLTVDLGDRCTPGVTLACDSAEEPVDGDLVHIRFRKGHPLREIIGLFRRTHDGCVIFRDDLDMIEVPYAMIDTLSRGVEISIPIEVRERQVDEMGRR